MAASGACFKTVDRLRIRHRISTFLDRRRGGAEARVCFGLGHQHQAAMEIDREAALPLTADDALPETGEIASSDVLAVEALAVRTGISGDEAQDLIDRLGSDRTASEQAARNLKSKRKS